VGVSGALPYCYTLGRDGEVGDLAKVAITCQPEMKQAGDVIVRTDGLIPLIQI